MKRLNNYINSCITEKLKIGNSTSAWAYNYHPQSRKELNSILSDLIAKRGLNADLNDIDVSAVTNMSKLFFFYPGFDGDISSWNVSSVQDMEYMFAGSKFNGDISRWDVSNVRNMSYMFSESKFNQDISRWDVSNAKVMSCMFLGSDFNQDLSQWNVKPRCLKICMFLNSPLENNPPAWAR